ncbi:MAG TPA: 3',5'-cyclic-nucleotide phosphodiesterase [Bacteriovoracaceae bacterium]|nr:3',5'-cyclic-nucleotide phosphodiesterase [Bacteriovoracaceae bacterium]
MIIRVLGGHGGKAPGFETTSFLVDASLLVDAGAVAGTISIEEQKKIDNILISHVHLDHIKDLAFICDNCFGLRPEPFNVYTHATVKKMIKAHLLNDIIWPDFTKLPTEEKPTMRIHPVEPEVPFKISNYQVTPVRVNHAHDALGYIIDDGKSCVLFTGDTGPTERIWEFAKGIKNLKAIFTEVSFPNKLQRVADLSDHHTSDSMKKELLKMPKDVTIILTHLKPNYRELVAQEIRSLGDPRIRVLERDGETFNF